MVSQIVFIETPVTDYLYSATKINTVLAEKFFQSLQPVPRAGDNYSTSKEVLDERLQSFAKRNAILLDGASTSEQQIIRIREAIFGKPVVEAGGALANSFDTLVKASINGSSLTDGVFVTAIGEGVSGRVFADSLPGKLIHPPAQGWQLESHIFPVDGNDRVMFSVPSLTNPPSRFMSASQLDQADIGPGTRMIALGGYMKYTGKYNEFFDAIVRKAESVSADPLQRPTIVLTAASQNVAESEDLRNALSRASRVAPVLVFANAGEFRRLMNMDTEWRRPHEHKWHKNGTPLEGNDLETAKWADDAYRNDKLAANQAAYSAAFELARRNDLPITFVVTNGKRGVHVVDGNGVSANYLPPRPPHGVVNTVGAGDGFAGGYMLGVVRNLSQSDCVNLGFVCAGEVIGQDSARLRPKTTAPDFDGARITLAGLPAYLDPQNTVHRGILRQLVQAPPEPKYPALDRRSGFPSAGYGSSSNA